MANLYVRMILKGKKEFNTIKSKKIKEQVRLILIERGLEEYIN